MSAAVDDSAHRLPVRLACRRRWETVVESIAMPLFVGVAMRSMAVGVCGVRGSMLPSRCLAHATI